MRNLLVTSAMVSMAIASGVEAQERVVVRGPAPVTSPAPTRPVVTPSPANTPQPQNGRGWTTNTAAPSAGKWQRGEIGRASCRERV